jgi:hypothetical protein
MSDLEEALKVYLKNVEPSEINALLKNFEVRGNNWEYSIFENGKNTSMVLAVPQMNYLGFQLNKKNTKVKLTYFKYSPPGLRRLPFGDE